MATFEKTEVPTSLLERLSKAGLSEDNNYKLKFRGINSIGESVYVLTDTLPTPRPIGPPLFYLCKEGHVREVYSFWDAFYFDGMDAETD